MRTTSARSDAPTGEGPSATGFKTLLAGAACVLAVSIWAALASVWPPEQDLGFSWRVLAFSSLFVAGSLLWGVVPALWAPAAPRHWDLPLTIVVGSTLLTTLLMILALVVPLGPWLTLPMLVLAGASVMLSSSRKRDAAAAVLSRASPLSLLAVALSLVAATLWTRTYLFAFEDLAHTVVYGPWADGFPLAQLVDLFSEAPRPQVRGKLNLAGATLPVYHYGAYAAGGAFAGITDAPSLTAVNAFLTPWSLFLVFMSAFSLGRRWWGPGLGLASLAAAAVLPDASLYGIENGWFGYYWLLMISPSLAWGVAIATSAVVLVDAGSEDADWRLVAVGLVLAGLGIVFKAQIAVLAFPLLAVWSTIVFRGLPRGLRTALVTATAIALMLLGQLASFFSLAPTFRLGGGLGKAYFTWLAAGVQNPVVLDIWRRAAESGGFPLRLVLLSIGAFGVLGLLYAIVLVIRKVRGQLKTGDLLPAFVLIAHLAMVFGFERSVNSNPWELLHRPFVFAYLLLAVWCGGAVMSLVAWPRRIRRFAWAALVLLAFPLFLAGETTGKRVWFSKNFLSTPISKDHLAAIRFLRAHSTSSEVIQASDLDPIAITSALAERPTYLARPRQMSKTSTWGTTIERRKSELETLAATESLAAFRMLVSELPIRWYILMPDAQVSWPDAVTSRPAFEAGGHRVIDLEPWRQSP